MLNREDSRTEQPYSMEATTPFTGVVVVEAVKHLLLDAS